MSDTTAQQLLQLARAILATIILMALLLAVLLCPELLANAQKANAWQVFGDLTGALGNVTHVYLLLVMQHMKTLKQ